MNRQSRKPFYWGGLKGYEQLQAIGQALNEVPPGEPETAYLQQLARQVNRTVEQNRVLAQDLQKAHVQLRHIAECLRYPPPSSSTSDTSQASLTGKQVQQEMEELLEKFQPDLKRCPAQAALYNTWHRVWENCGDELLHCYDIPGLPQDNLGLEALFGRLRNHQRRVSGRASTRKLRDFGQYQVLFLAESENELLGQIQQVHLNEYREHRRRLAEAEAPRRLLHRLHHDPISTIRSLLNHHAVHRTESATSRPPPKGDN